MIEQLWLEEYKGQYSKVATQSAQCQEGLEPHPVVAKLKTSNMFTSLKNYKRQKLSHLNNSALEVDEYKAYLETNLLVFENE